MDLKIIQKGNKFFELYDKDNNQYSLFFRESKNKTPSFTICLIQEVSPSKSICYKKTFLLEEFNLIVKDYKSYDSINLIITDLVADIMSQNIEIHHMDESTKSINILLNSTFPINFQMNKVHEIFEFNEILKRAKDKIIQTNNMKNKINMLSNNIRKCDEVNKNNDVKIQNLKNVTTRLFNLFNNYKNNMNKNNYPPEDIMLTLTKEERYRILGIQSDIVHAVNELFYISRWLSSEKVTKLNLLFKGAFINFDAVAFHSQYDNIVPCLILIETTSGARFGGFTNKTWKGENEYKKDNTAFLFSLDFLEKYPIHPQCIDNAILAKTQYLFSFGKGDLIIYGSCNRFICKSDFPVSYICQNRNVDPKYRLTKYNHEFVVKDLEVYLVEFTMKNY